METSDFAGIAPNFAVIEVSDSSAAIFKTEYSREIWEECINENTDTFYFRWGNHIYAWSKSCANEECPIGFSPTTVTLQDEPDIFSKIVQQGIINYFSKIGRSPFRKKYSSVYSFQIEQAQQKYAVSNLSYLPFFCFSIGYFRHTDQNLLFITSWKEFRPRFEVPESTIQSQGIDTTNWDRNRTGDQLVGSSRNIRIYLDAVKGERQKKEIEAKMFNKIGEFSHIKKTFQTLNSSSSEISLINGMKIFGFRHLAIPNENFKEFFIEKPDHFYYNNGTTRGGYDQAVSNLKPYTYEYMSTKTFQIAAFVPKVHSGTCDTFLQNLQSRLRDIFHLSNVEISVIEVGINRNDHMAAISSFTHQAYDLAIFFLNFADKGQQQLQSDYNKIKAKLLGKGIPSQNVLIETVRNANKFTLNNISLNIYSKLGGTPWIINKDDKSAVELVIGIGSSLDSNNDRTIGFASVFDHQGSYILGGCSPLSDMANYTTRLKDHIIGIVSEAIQLQTVQHDSTIRLIFHIFKDASKRYEIRAILEAIEQFSDYKIEYSLVHISYEHPFRLYQGEGKDIVRRGTYIEISEGWALLSMGGKRSSPLLVKLDPRSTYKDLYDISKQVLYFAHLSHKSFMPSNEPVTTKYSSELARRTNDLLTVEHWDVDMLTQLKDRVWFI